MVLERSHRFVGAKEKRGIDRIQTREDNLIFRAQKLFVKEIGEHGLGCNAKLFCWTTFRHVEIDRKKMME